MQSVFTLNANELNNNFLLAVQNLFGNRKIEIVVKDTQDETEDAFYSSTNMARLKKAVQDVKSGKAKFTVHELVEDVND